MLQKDKKATINHNERSNHDEHTNHSEHGNHDEHASHEEHTDHNEHSNHTQHDNHDMNNHEGHSDHSSHVEIFKKKFFVSLFLAIPVLLIAPLMGIDFFPIITFKYSEWVVLILSTILYFYGGMPFLSGAKDELKTKSPAMMTLISLGITVAYVYSVYAFIANNILHLNTHVMDFFWELASLIVIMLLGHWLEMRAVSSAGNALQKMAELLPADAHLILEDGTTKEVPLQNIQIDNKILVPAGEKIPTDGIIISGSTTVNESMVTGEAKDVSKNKNDKVIGGSINGSGVIEILVTGTGESGYLSQVMNLVETAQAEKSKAESLSDLVAKVLFYVALIVGIGAFIIWFVVTKDINIALERMVTVLIIACPHALGLAIPLVTARSTSLGAQNGLLIKNRKALEAAKNVDIIMMDKTGTLTEGNFTVSKYISFDENYTDNEVLGIIGSLEESSTHPLAVGILEKIALEKISIPKAENIKNLPGIGIQGNLNGKNIKVASVSYLDDNNIPYDKEQFINLSSLGNSISFLIIDEKNIGLVAQGDQIKEESFHMIEELNKQNIKPVMLTGDNKHSAEVVAKQLGIENVRAQLLPEDKEKIVKEYIDKGFSVMMVGDGVNDAPSLARANIGVAIGAGTDVAIDSADVILVKSNPSDILHFLTLAKNTNKKMVQNLWWGAGYNIIAIPLAAGVLSFAGIILSPAVGAILMSLSTIIVAVNAMTLNIK